MKSEKMSTKLQEVVEMMLDAIGKSFIHIFANIHNLDLDLVNDRYVREPNLKGYLYQMCIGGLFIEIFEVKEEIYKIRMQGCQNNSKNYNIVKSAIETACPSIRWERALVCKYGGKVCGTSEDAYFEFPDQQSARYFSLYQDDLLELCVALLVRGK